ncbi:MAG: methyltransferase domain-containing protein [Chloroflexi bacterium]|nr:methyltransferase domain-containing protein [Chloroflexota bacterium]
MSAIEHYAARVDAVLAQRARLRGHSPPGDPFADLRPDHPLTKTDPRRPLDPTLELIVSYLDPEDVVVDVGGGGGRNGLPVALRCREVVNVDPSVTMLHAFRLNARHAGIHNAIAIHGDWLTLEPPPDGTVALVNHVTYLTREIEAFILKLTRAASQRVIMGVGDPPPPSRNRLVFEVAYEEPSEVVPGHAELLDVLQEMGIEPEVHHLPMMPMTTDAAPTYEAAVDLAMAQLRGHQWAFWPLEPSLDVAARARVVARFDELFEHDAAGFRPRWTVPGREVILTWSCR